MNFRSSEPAAAFQLTHSRGVRLSEMNSVGAEVMISTHALTWSATRAIVVQGDTLSISTHALT